MPPVASYYNHYPIYHLPHPDAIPDTEQDHPRPNLDLVTDKIGRFQIPPLVFGAATLSHHYNDLHSFLHSDVPLRVVRLALRYGISAFDTSPYYGSSEVALGQILAALEPEYPRSSYKLMTKCGRYGFHKSEFDYSPETIRASISRSLERLHTEYLDVAYLHDVEFVASPVYPEERSGNPQDALTSSSGAWGLDEVARQRIHGAGDQIILDALAELFKLKREGKVKAVGITGYSLPVLLRLATLATAQPSLEPVDIILTFCHLTLQNSSLRTYLPLLKEWGKVSQIVAASPLSMGLLTPSPPTWHPAPEAMLKGSQEAEELCKTEGTGLAAVALHHSLHSSQKLGNEPMPVVIGLSQLREVHELMEAFQDKPEGKEKVVALEQKIQALYRSLGYENWSWASPPNNFE